VIHCQGDTRDGCFAVLDCRRLPPVAVAAALFEGGRLVRRAGTIFLREPACLSRDLQAVLVAWMAEAGPAPASSPDAERRCRGGRSGGLTPELAAALTILSWTLPARRLDDLAWLAERMLRNSGRSARHAKVDVAVRPLWSANLPNSSGHGRGRRHAVGGRIDTPAYLRLGWELPHRAPPLKTAAQAERQLIVLLRRCKGNAVGLRMLSFRPKLLRRMVRRSSAAWTWTRKAPGE
jgi:hypothetical protein